MPKIYFTYGTSNLQPYCGGWTEITAPTENQAYKIFRMLHPSESPNAPLNCAGVYTEDTFKKTKMFAENNLGAGCHESINLSVSLSPITSGFYIVSGDITSAEPHILRSQTDVPAPVMFKITADKEMYETIYRSATGTSNTSNVDIITTTYVEYNNLCIALETSDTHEAYAVLTVNLQRLPANQAAIDTNNHPEAPEFIESNNLGHATGRTIKSGFCEYPVYEFDMNRLPPIQY